MTDFSPHPYQQTAIDFAEGQRYCMLAMEMGLGKTVVTGTVIARWLSYCESRRVLIVAPKRVANHTWPAEFAKWSHLRHLRVVKLTGTEKQRIAGLRRRDGDVYLINRENLQWLAAGYHRAGMAWPFDTVIIDESTSFKDSSTKRWKALAAMRAHIHRMILLTGMPVTNSHIDLWAQLYLLDAGQRLLPTLTAYRDYAFDLDYDGRTWKLKKGDTADWIHDRIRDIVLPMRARDHITMPELRVIDVPVTLPPAGRAVYEQMVKTLKAQMRDDTQVVAVNAAVLVGKLAQIANGMAYDADGAVHLIHDAKLEALDDLLEAAAGEPVMVVYNFRADLERLRKRYPHGRNINDRGAIDAWNRGEVPLLWLHPASAGHGLNLQDGGHHMIWFGPTYSLELYLQTIARLFRQGQPSAVVFVHRILAEDTIDQGIVEILEGKDVNLTYLMTELART